MVLWTVSDVTLDVMILAELKFSLEKWHKGKYDVGQNDNMAYYCTTKVSLSIFDGLFYKMENQKEINVLSGRC